MMSKTIWIEAHYTSGALSFEVSRLLNMAIDPLPASLVGPIIRQRCRPRGLVHEQKGTTVVLRHATA